MRCDQRSRPEEGRGSRSRITYPCLGLLLSIFLAACATPITVTRVDTRTTYQELTRNALSAGQMSTYSEIILNRANLAERFKADPEAALADLHWWVANDWLDRDPIFALAGGGEAGMLRILTESIPVSRKCSRISLGPCRSS